MGAIVGVRLTTRISDVLGVKMDKVTFWCDSVNFCGGSEDEAVISSLLLPTESGKFKQIHNQRNGGMCLQASTRRTCSAEECMRAILPNAIHGGEDLNFYYSQKLRGL